MNYYDHHIGDFRSGTVNMTRVERWIYRDMLDVYYDTEEPLPADIEKLCKAIGVRSAEEKAAVVDLLSYKFTLTDRGYEHERCEAEIAKYRSKADVARENGRLGGRPKGTKTKPEGNPEKPSGFSSVSKPNPDQTGSQANQEPITNNQEPKSLTLLSGKPDDGCQVLEHLNAKAKRDFRPVPATMRIIRARLKEGATVADMQAVVDMKVRQWTGTKFEQYLRPETLFGASKFAQYVGQLGAPLPGDDRSIEGFLATFGPEDDGMTIDMEAANHA
jgi:uncharacterized phage protein (TIGR02220 family)